MIRSLLLVTARMLPLTAVADFTEQRPLGFHWYTHKQSVATVLPKPQVSVREVRTVSHLRPYQQLQYLSGKTKDTLAIALLHPSVAHTTNYMRAQQWWARRDQTFVQDWKEALIEHPELDYSLRFPTDNSAIPIRNDEHKMLVEHTIDTMSRHYGLIFFYRGNSSICQKFAGILSTFVKKRHFSMVSVTTDHQPIIGLPNPRAIPMREVHRVLGIESRYLPALFLVNLKTHRMKALSYGFLALADLKERFLDVENHFATYSYNGLGEAEQ